MTILYPTPVHPHTNDPPHTIEPISWWPHDFMVTNWRALHGGATPLRLEILAKSGGVCWYCGTELQTATMHMDHLIPVISGGRGDYENIVPSCPACNMSKGINSIEEWRIKAGRKYADIEMPPFSATQRQWLDDQGFTFPPIPYVIFWFESEGLS